MQGLLVLDKPAGITSRDAVNTAQTWFPRGTALGHAGTLDPLATGVLVVAVGPATKLVEYVQRMAKVYTSTFRLGATSDSDDADGTVTESAEAIAPDREAVAAALRGQVGEISQIPPSFSAAHVGGRRAYALARRGETVTLEPRLIRVDSIEIVRYEYPWLDIEVRCGKGTYIRSLARDVGNLLGVGGMVQVLRRTHIGGFGAEDAVPMTATPSEARARLRPSLDALTELRRLTLAAPEALRLRQGQRLAMAGPEGEVAVVDEAGALVAIGEVTAGRLRPVKVWN